MNTPNIEETPNKFDGLKILGLFFSAAILTIFISLFFHPKPNYSEFLKPSNNKLEVVAVHCNHNGCIAILESPATGRRKAIKIDLRSEELPVVGEIWYGKITKTGQLAIAGRE